MPDVALKSRFPTRLQPSSASGPKTIYNGRKGYADPIAELEDAAIFLHGARKLSIPGMCRRANVPPGTSRTWDFTLAREMYTSHTRVHVVFKPGGGKGSVSCASATYGAGGSVLVEKVPQNPASPYRVATLDLKFGAGDASGVGEEEVSVTVTHDAGAEVTFTVFAISFEPVALTTIGVDP